MPKDYHDLYLELIYAVATKYPGESRHETALRYIREREQGGREVAASSGVSARAFVALM